MKKEGQIVTDDAVINYDGTGFIFSMQAAVVMGNSKDMVAYDVDPLPVPANPNADPGKRKKFMPWGEDNDLPQKIIAKVKASEVLSAGLLFNVEVGYGNGIVPMRRKLVDGKIVFEEAIVPEIDDFLEENNINTYLLEQLTDLKFFQNIFPEIILNRKRDKIVELNHKEAAFSRWGEPNDKGIIEDHYYSANWDNNPKWSDITDTRVLNAHKPLRDLLERLGRQRDRNGRDRKENYVYRYIVPVRFPSPGSYVYNWAYWHAVFSSGWYDFLASIPEWKKAKISNSISPRYIVYLSEDYFTKIFSEENITTDKEKEARKKKEFGSIKDFITGAKNAGKTIVSYVKYTPDGKEIRRIKIEELTTSKEGGDYLEDSEEGSNMMSYALGVHPSLIGAVPGKNKGSFSGTDKRELFIIKQALMKPMRDMLLKPLMIVKKVNRWPEDIFFTIPNITLTTLDKGKEKETTIPTNAPE